MYLRFAATALFALPLLQAQQPDALLTRMDQAAAAFKGMTAKIRKVSHTAVINEDNVETGTVAVKKKGGKLRMLTHLTAPDEKSVAFEGRKLEIFYPKIQTVQEFDVGKSRDMLEQFFLLGFGTRRKDLERDYTLKATGNEVIGGTKTSRLELTPKSPEIQKQLKKVELSISDATGYPVQQKFHQSADDYHFVTYSDLKINPDLPDSALKLKLPPGVKREFPQK